MSLSLQQRYGELVAANRLEPDPAQMTLIERLDALLARLADYVPARPPNALERLIGVRPAEAPRGLYIFGPVGRGKTLLMDLFFEAAPAKAKRRVHFHAFMADVHARIHQWRTHRRAGEVAGEDPIAPVAADMAAQAWLLCFDEFSVRDIADAMILGRLFTQLFVAGVVVVATSNVAPDDLYKDGLNRALFLPFIAMLHQRLEICALEARTDFRLEKLARAPVYYCPPDAAAKSALDDAFKRLTGHEHGAPAEIALLGRSLKIPEASDGVARFSFDDLCRQPLGSSDFLAIAQRFHTVLIDHIRVMSRDQRNEAKRFINLIDTLYDQRVKLIASAEAEPNALFLGEDGYEVFEFDRTASRLIEMRSADYLALAHGHSGSSASGDMGGLIET
ncbi:cell division protein ZapE [Methylocapsa sp. S129]|uniref:cell division protein ZapE n=1 Tax=Methylocapsa sp. S129 TaxID=1641869 RepID=UPI00131BBA6D|nr:cell division protein ZapE [Methylocapsa sp. S129]